MILLKNILKSSKLQQLQKIQKRPFADLNDIVELSEDHKMIYQTALNFANENMAPYALEWDKKSHFPVDVIRQAAQLGFGSIYTSQDQGGCGMDRLSASLVFEALATACVSTSSYLSIHNMNCWIIDTFGNEEQKKEWLPQLVNMEKFTSYCLTEPQSGSDAGAMKTFAKKVGGDYVINGSKCFITGGGVSDYYILMCLTGEKQRSILFVPKDAQGLSFGSPEIKMGWKSSPTAVITLEDVKVPLRNLISQEGNGFKIALMGLDGGRVNIASTSVGGAAQCLEKTREYLFTRKQFGKNLSEFQHLQFQYAQMITDLAISRLMVRQAAKKIDQNDENKALYAAMAKLTATEKCYNIVDGCLQMHGGYGYIWETGIERFSRDLRVNRILEGTTEIMKHIISRTTLKQ